VLEWIERFEKATALLPCAAYQPYGLDAPSLSVESELS
jgi:hypothetical protein